MKNEFHTTTFEDVEATAHEFGRVVVRLPEYGQFIETSVQSFEMLRAAELGEVEEIVPLTTMLQRAVTFDNVAQRVATELKQERSDDAE